MKYIVFLFLLVSPLTLMAGGDEITSDELQEINDLASDLAVCSGAYQAISEYLESSHPLTSKNYTGLKYGAEYSALYLFTNLKVAVDKIPRKYSESMLQVDSIARGAYINTASRLEISGITGLGAVLKRCIPLNKIQGEIIKLMRKKIYK